MENKLSTVTSFENAPPGLIHIFGGKLKKITHAGACSQRYIRTCSQRCIRTCGGDLSTEKKNSRGAKFPRGVKSLFFCSGHQPDTHKHILCRGSLALEPTMSGLLWTICYEKAFKTQETGGWGSLCRSPPGDEAPSDCNNNNDNISNILYVAGRTALEFSVNAPGG